MAAGAKRNLVRFIAPAVSAALLVAVLFVLHRELRHIAPRDVWRQMRALPPVDLLVAMLLSAAGYAVLTGYDVLAFRYLRHPLPYRRVVFSSFVSFVFSHNVGLSFLGGSAVRYRLLSSWGLSTLDIATVVGFCIGTFWTGWALLTGITLIGFPPPLPEFLNLPPGFERGVGALMLALVVVYVVWSRSGRALKIGARTIVPPSPSISLRQFAVSSADWMFAAGVLYVLLPPAQGLSYPRFLGLYLLATIVALAAHVPAAIGVLETVMVLMLHPYLPADSVLGSVLLFRIVYHLLPFVVGVSMLAAHEVAAGRRSLGRWRGTLDRWTVQVAPRALALTILIAGAMLLVAGATPDVDERIAWLRSRVPLALIEAAHLAGSVAGMGLMVLARGIQRRVRSAYRTALALLAIGIVASMFKGLDWEEALALVLVLAVFAPFRRHFYRPGPWLNRPLSPEWLTGIAAVLVGVGFLVAWGYRAVDYSGALWWRFAFDSDASRALRAMAAAAGLLLAATVMRVLRPATPPIRKPDAGQLETIRAIVAESPSSASRIALLGDASILFDRSRSAFVMYGTRRTSWIAIGDPVGPASERLELAWRFRELADRHAGRTVFFAVRADTLGIYLELGLTLLELGEEARVRLEEIAGDRGDGPGEFTVLGPDEAALAMPELREVAEASAVRERRFAGGRFDEAFIATAPVAAIRQGGRVVCFGSLWPSAGQEELALEVVRHRSDAPADIVDSLLARTMAWGRDEGYRWFNLGLTPLAGPNDPRLAPLWRRVGTRLYRHGEHFDDPAELRRAKAAWDPVWSPRYLALPGGLVHARVLTDLAILIDGDDPDDRRR